MDYGIMSDDSKDFTHSKARQTENRACRLKQTVDGLS